MTAAPSVHIRRELRDLESQLRRMGTAHRVRKEATEFDAAEVSALFHLAELRSWVDKLGAD